MRFGDRPNPPRQDRRLSKVLAALHTHGGPGRSALYRWMRRHHDTLAAAFAETSPAWGPLASELAAVGLTGADGKPPSASNARQTWYRVRRDLARAREQQPNAGPGLAPYEIAPGVHVAAAPAAGWVCKSSRLNDAERDGVTGKKELTGGAGRKVAVAT